MQQFPALAMMQSSSLSAIEPEGLVGIVLLGSFLGLLAAIVRTNRINVRPANQLWQPSWHTAGGVLLIVLGCAVAALLTQHLASLPGLEFLWYLAAILTAGACGYAAARFHQGSRSSQKTKPAHISPSATEASLTLQLQHVQSRLAMITESLPVGMFEADVAGRCRYLTPNCAQILGVSFLDGMIGSWFDHVLQGDREELTQSWRTSWESREPFAAECRVRAVDGGIRWIHVRCRVLIDDFGVVYVGSVEDITQHRRSARQLQKSIETLDFLRLKEQEKSRLLQQTVEELEQASQHAKHSCEAKSVFLANMSHEIRTPMTAILGFTDLLLEERGGSSASDSWLQTIRRNAEYLLNLLDDILDLSKIEAGKLDLEHISCSPREIVHEVVELMQIRLRGRPEVELRQTISRRAPRSLVADPTRLKQVLMNLVGNSIKFTERGVVKIALDYEPGKSGESDSGHLIFEVQDSGIGMTPEQLTRLYQPFGQADSSTTRRFGGTGLGLTICKHFVDEMSGQVEVESQPGQGTTFRVRLPAVDPLFDDCELSNLPLQVVAAPASSKPQEGLLDHTRILLAEDSPDNQRLINYLLTKAGAIVTIVENGQLALTEVLKAAPSNQAFDIVLMDMQMPVMDGYTATQRLRDVGFQGPIVALTAHAMQGDKERCLAAGCNAYETKPVQRQALLHTLKRLLDEAHVTNPITALQ